MKRKSAKNFLIITLNPKPVPKAIPQPPKSVVSTPKLIAKTTFPKRAPEGTRPPKREAGLGEDKRKSLTTPKSTKPDRISWPASSEAPQASQLKIPRVSADLEMRFRALELSQKNLVESAKIWGELEYLAISKNSSGQFCITVEGTGKPFIRRPFATYEFCLEAAFEIEDVFEIEQVIELRPPETIERIEDIVGVWLERERVDGN